MRFLNLKSVNFKVLFSYWPGRVRIVACRWRRGNLGLCGAACFFRLSACSLPLSPRIQHFSLATYPPFLPEKCTFHLPLPNLRQRPAALVERQAIPQGGLVPFAQVLQNWRRGHAHLWSALSSSNMQNPSSSSMYVTQRRTRVSVSGTRFISIK